MMKFREWRLVRESANLSTLGVKSPHAMLGNQPQEMGGEPQQIIHHHIHHHAEPGMPSLEDPELAGTAGAVAGQDDMGMGDDDGLGDMSGAQDIMSLLRQRDSEDGVGGPEDGADDMAGMNGEMGDEMGDDAEGGERDNPFAADDEEGGDTDGDGDVDADDDVEGGSDNPFGGDDDMDGEEEDDAAGSPFAPAATDDGDDADDDSDDEVPKKSPPPAKKKDDKKEETAAFLRSLISQGTGDSRRKNSSGLRMKEDALILAQDPNSGFTSGSKPGEPGFAPQGIVGANQDVDLNDFNEWLSSYKRPAPKARKKK
jgi:hypothetical protein